MHLINFPNGFAQNFAAIFASQFFPEKLAQKFVVAFAEILAIAKIIDNIYRFFFGKCKIFHKKYEKNYGNNLNFLYVGMGWKSLCGVIYRASLPDSNKASLKILNALEK